MNTSRYLMAAVVGAAALATAPGTTKAAPGPQGAPALEAQPPGKAEVEAPADAKAAADAEAPPRLSSPPAARHVKTNTIRRLRAEAVKPVEGIPFEGRLDQIGDGLVLVSQPVPAGTRKIVSDGRQIPLSQVPQRATRTVYLTPKIDLDQLRKLEGQPVRATFRLNGLGYFELTEIVRDERLKSTPQKP